LDALRSLVEADPRATTRSLAATLHCSNAAIDNHIHSIGKVLKMGSWVPHTLTQRDLDARSEACTHLLSRRRSFDWLDHVVTGDEKWCLYITGLLHKWGYIESPLCTCGEVQTMKHIAEECPDLAFPGLSEIHQASPEALQWLRDLPITL